MARVAVFAARVAVLTLCSAVFALLRLRNAVQSRSSGGARRASGPNVRALVDLDLTSSLRVADPTDGGKSEREAHGGGGGSGLRRAHARRLARPAVACSDTPTGDDMGPPRRAVRAGRTCDVGRIVARGTHFFDTTVNSSASQPSSAKKVRK